MLDLCFHIYTVEKHNDKMEKTNHEKAKVKHIYIDMQKCIYKTWNDIFISYVIYKKIIYNTVRYVIYKHHSSLLCKRE